MNMYATSSGILSDRQIKLLCVDRTAVVRHRQKCDTRRMLSEAETYLYTREGTPEREEELKHVMPEEDAEKGYYKITELNPRENFHPMISPFYSELQRTKAILEHSATDGIENDRYGEEKIISYGLTSYGYDVRCADEFKIFTNINSTRVDPKKFDPKNFVDFKGPVCVIPPNSFILARTVERFNLPRDIVADCLGKSTYARCGISVMVTPLEPEWEGYLTLEFANTTPLPALIYANEGCAQIRFFRGSDPCEVSYKDRGGKYMGQEAAPIPPRL